MAYLGRQPNTGVRSRYIYTATASQTTFSGTDDDGKTLKYEDAAYLDVFLNGVLLKPVTDYTATSKTSVVLTSAAAASDIVEIVAYDIANMANTVSATNGGTFEADVTVQGTVTSDGLTVDTNTLYVDAANNRVGVGTASPASSLDVSGTVTSDGLSVDGGTIKLDGNYPLGTNNTGLGDTVLESISSGSSNTAVGKNAMNDATTASNNVAVGQGALTSTTSGGKNVALGMSSLAFSTTATNNTASGYQAGYSVTTGSGNSYYGYLAGRASTVGGANVSVGQNALSANQGGSRNVAIGADALQTYNYTTVANTYNVSIGYEAMHDATTSLQNTAVGGFALRGNTTGSYNTVVGYEAGYYITTGSKNTILGHYNGNQGGLDIRTSSNNIVLSDGDGNPRLRVESSGTINFVEHTSANVVNGTGAYVNSNGQFYASTSSSAGHFFNVQNDNQTVLVFRHAGVSEGNIHINGSSVTYNGFSGTHESSGIASDTAIGTVCSTIDELDTYAFTQIGPDGTESNPRAGQTRTDHAKIKVSDQEGDARVYGVLQGFDPNGKATVASVGIGSVLVTGACSGGDLLESNGDGTAKVQSDDIVRSKTIGKVTIGDSNTGVKLVSCVLYCG